MPPSTLDLIRARITRLLNEKSWRPFTSAVAHDNGTHIIYEHDGRTFEITVKESTDG